MAKKTNKMNSEVEMVTASGGRQFITPSGEKLVIDNKGGVSFVDADNELIFSVDRRNGNIYIATDKVKEIIDEGTTDEKPAVTPSGEEWEDEIFRQHNVFEKLVSQTKKAKPSPNWRAELDEL